MEISLNQVVSVRELCGRKFIDNELLLDHLDLFVEGLKVAELELVDVLE